MPKMKYSLVIQLMLQMSNDSDYIYIHTSFS